MNQLLGYGLALLLISTVIMAGACGGDDDDRPPAGSGRNSSDGDDDGEGETSDRDVVLPDSGGADGADGADVGDPKGSPKEKCQALLYAICEKAAQCELMPSTQTCLSGFEEIPYYSCDDVVQVTASYDECMSEIQKISCQEMEQVEFPISCRGVLLQL